MQHSACRRVSWQLAGVLVTAMLLSGVSAYAQTLYGSLVGTVTDASGAAVPNVTVTVTNKETNLVRAVTTNDSGQYNVTTVQPGTYSVKVVGNGFRPAQEDNVAVSANSQARVNIALQVGSVNESVLVSAQAQVLQTDRAEVRNEITTKTLTDVPVPGQRNYQALFITIPGISPPSQPHSIPSNPSRAMQFSANGTNTAANNTRIDGASATNIWLPHIASYVPALESIETVNIVTNSFDAEQGLAGGAAVNVMIRSGSNDLHGAAFAYHMGNWSQSRNFFLPSNQDIPKFVYNQFGGRIGGHIIKDKLFYFTSYEGTTDRRFSSGFYTVPDAAMRTGDLSRAGTGIVIYDPGSVTSDGSGRVPFAGNQIPADRIDATAKRLLALLPLPNINTNGVLTNNYYSGARYLFDRHTVDSKVNWNISDKWTSYGRLSWLKFDTTQGTAFGPGIGGPPVGGGNPGAGYGGTWTGTLATTYTVTPTFIVDAYFGYTLMDSNVEQPGLGENIGRDQLGIPGTNGTRRFESGFPGFGIGSFTVFGSTESYMPYFRHDPQFQYVANANWTKGSHNIRFGVDIYRLALNHTQPEFASGGTSSAAGRLDFGQGPTQARINGVTTAGNDYNAFASFLLGRVTGGGRLLQVPDEYSTRTAMYSAYVRDQWQVNRKLTLNFGTRYEYFPMPTRADRGMERYDFATNEMLVCGTASIPKDCGTKVSKLLFSPRIGVAYRLSDRTVVRSGFGLNWDPWNLARPLRTNFPILVVNNLQTPDSLGWATTLTQGLPQVPVPQVGSNGRLLLPTSYAVNTTDDSYKRGYILSWNATVERQLGKGFVGQVGYVANRSVNIAGVVNVNAGQVIGAGRNGQPLFQKFGRQAETNLVDNWSYSTYHSLQAQLNRRFSNGVQIGAAYTWSKVIGFCCNNDNNGGPRIPAISYLDLNRSVLDFDRTHNLQITGVVELPFGRGKKFLSSGIGAAVAGGWQLNTLTSFLSGLPVSVTSDAGSLNMPGSTQRADQVKPEVQKLGGIGRGTPYFDPFAFQRVTTARFGNAGFNSLRGPGWFNSDLGLFRQFSVNERVNLQFRAEAFNWTNTPKFNNPSSAINSLQLNPDGTFRGGVFEITGTNSLGRDVGDRIFRLGLRLAF